MMPSEHSESLQIIEYTEDVVGYAKEDPKNREARHLAARRFEEFAAHTVVQYLRDSVYWEKELHELVFSGRTYGPLIPPKVKLPGYKIVGQAKREYFSLVRSTLDGQEFWVEPAAWAALGEQVRNLLNKELPQYLAGEMRISSGGLVQISKGTLTRAAYAQPLLVLERLVA